MIDIIYIPINDIINIIWLKMVISYKCKIKLNGSAVNYDIFINVKNG